MLRRPHVLWCCCFLAVAGHVLAQPEQPEPLQAEQVEPQDLICSERARHLRA